MAASLLGRSIGRYRITARLGEGGMGVVYRAYDATLGREVAVKFLRPDAGHQPERLRRFSHEARAASALNHPNIVTVHDAGEFEDGPFLVMELVEGESLRARVRRGSLPLSQVLDIGVQIAAALSRAHDSGITHRDLKPENLVLRPDGYVKILDFGLAKLKEPEAFEGGSMATTLDASVTGEGAILGTAAYMSPEQAMGLPADARSDIFSLALVLLEMWQGRNPFARRNTLETLHAIAHDRLPAFRYEAGSVESGFGRVLEKALAKPADQRYPSMKDLEVDLRRLRQESESGAITGSAGIARPAVVSRTSRYVVMLLVLVFAGLGAAGLWLWGERRRIVRENAIQEVGRLADAGAMIEAYRLARILDERKPNDPAVQRIWETVGPVRNILTDPPEADIYMRDYLKPDSEWIRLGRSPLIAIRLPFLFLTLRASKPGYQEVEWSLRPLDESRIKLFPKESHPPGMVLVFGKGRIDQPLPLDDFWLDRYEVTNAEYKKFVDAGGYRNRKFWKEPFVESGKTRTWEEAMARLVDSTNRPGPAHWELGSYPEGTGNLPVTGVSWFEAAAYAEFAGKNLPTVYHWRQAALYQPMSSEIILLSNFAGKGPAAPGTFRGAGFFGNYDLAGNIKEWCWNSTGEKRYILGGAWSEPRYMFAEDDARSPFDRAETFGFRCARYTAPIAEAVKAPLTPTMRDYAREKPASEEQFRAYKSVYAYDRTPLDPKVEMIDDNDPIGHVEKVTFNAAYGNERVIAYLYLPKNGRPPYQTVIHFPGAYALFLERIDGLGLYLSRYAVQSGRALLYPIYKGTYERRSKTRLAPLAWRDLVIQMCKDLSRSVDYVLTRADMDHVRIAYDGQSMGATTAVPCLAVEDRFRAAILNGGGFARGHPAPEIDPINFASRIRIPVLMLNGRNDFMFPMEQLQLPMFHALGSAPSDKRHFLVESGHAVPRNLIVKEAVAWLDRYLGPVAGAP